MQRVTQMSVTPDLLPEIAPEADLRIRVGSEQIVPGVFTNPADVSPPCTVQVDDCTYY
jgi:large subunit ribosomal protein L35